MNALVIMWVLINLWYGQSVLRTHYKTPAPIRFAFIESLLLITTAAFILTEALSYFSQLNATNLIIAWSALAIFSTGWALFQYRRRVPLIRLRIGLLSNFEQQIMGFTAAVLSLTFLTAILYPPNNFDSLVYHMGRIGHWIQQQSIQPFATHIERQIYQPPLAEWLILHTMLLSQSDLWANSIQWLAGAGCLIALSVLSKQLGGSRTVQLATVFMAVTIPMVILQSSSTQNDVVVSFYLIVVVVYLVRYYQSRDIVSICWAGLALGFAFLTKGTAYLLGAPILLVWGGLELRQLVSGWGATTNGLRSLLKLALPAILLITISLSLNAGHYSRNLFVYGYPLTDPKTGSDYSNATHSAKMLVSNMSRNLALHFSFPGVHWVAQRGVEELHSWMNLTTHEKETTFEGSQFNLPRLSNNEENASSFLHILWIAASIVWILRQNKLSNRTSYLVLTGTIITAFLLFCFYLKWQPWHSRLHTTLFLLASPIGAVRLVAAIHEQIRWPFWVFMLSASCFALTNPFRPLITLPPLTQPISVLDSREQKYLVNGSLYRITFDQIASYVNQQQNDSTRVGLFLAENSFDYIWCQKLKSPIRLYHVRVQTSSRLLDKHPGVDYIISTQTWGDTLHYQNKLYSRIKPERGEIALFGLRK